MPDNSDQPVRKLVKPSVPGARIPDPAHRGMYIAAEGTEVVWDHSWILRERRGEIIIADAPGSNEPAKAEPEAPGA